MDGSLNKNIQKLTKLLEQSQNKKLLWEESQLISQKAFALQEMIMAELDKIEALETDVVKVQSAFTARESIWDVMSKITARELELKEKAHHKETPAERQKRHAAVMAESEHHCCCGHHHDHDCGCHGEHTSCRKGKKSCPKK